MSTDPRDLFVSLNPLGLDERDLKKDSTGFADMRTHGDYLVFLAGYKAGTVDGEERESQRHRPINAEGCKPDSDIQLSGPPSAGATPCRGLDTAEGCKPDLNILPTQTSASAEPDSDLCAEGAHEFVPFQSNCVKCSEPYQAATPPKVTPATLMRTMENLAVKALAAQHPPFFPSESACQAPLVMLGGVCLRVSYSGLKWYHDQLIDDRWEPLSVDEFEALLTDALRDSQGGNR
ncbi:hypothetical protein [Pseudomonas sp. RW405]|uniref:hypothetical protein n=1 Tax=Pseudomonas sp. RW405 TaxID=2202652 RepID=UPI000D731CFB|nr:hypothetical protein [Pseudomonas sp. RW405]PWY44398.1 hypothetical protein DK184_06720 [Pseudomonas sp. RW405]